jgi:DNA-binding response OmpR family regulator
LIVDDDDVITVGLTDYLELRGWSVDAAHDYDIAKSYIRSGDYTAAVIDVLITGRGTGDGLDFLAWLAGSAPDTVAVVLTAYGTRSVEHLARDRGVTLFFDKPKRFDEIAEVLAQIVVVDRPVRRQEVDVR